MRKRVFGLFRRVVKAVVYGLIGSFTVLIIGAVLFLNSRPELKVWHEADLDAEFTADSPVHSFEEYLALEERLFAQLEDRVYEQVQPADQYAINRYSSGSLSDPARWPTNWNHSFELTVASPRVGVLLLHGMSDSPYSLHSLGQRLQASGASVLGLRIPGHGTAPVGLTRVSREDMAAAVQLAMRHLRDTLGDKPIYIVGYSNGAALAVHYALSALDDPGLPPVSGLVLFSPAIGVSPAAAFAVWQSRLGHLLGLKKLEWNSLLPEYDPFKYGSFAVNAGDLVYRLTTEIQSRFDTLGEADLKRFPRVLAFQSAVDGTVSVKDLVHGLFERLPAGGHELVLFDINRLSEFEYLLAKDPGPQLDALLGNAGLSFAVSVVTNRDTMSRDIVIRHKEAGDAEVTTTATEFSWPEHVYSLSHIALPIPAQDPLYGGPDAGKSSGVRLGNLAFRGERGVLRVSASDMLRIRWNPFYPYLEQKAQDFMRLTP
ncbi:MAG TPA: alpha/beta fold hydrolase [Gammaproteobacteria bacterium]|nr:alpha/beta fold hydrolase [Gammaproteobacteria bacterium]